MPLSCFTSGLLTLFNDRARIKKGHLRNLKISWLYGSQLLVHVVDSVEEGHNTAFRTPSCRLHVVDTITKFGAVIIICQFKNPGTHSKLQRRPCRKITLKESNLEVNCESVNLLSVYLYVRTRPYRLPRATLNNSIIPISILLLGVKLKQVVYSYSFS